MQLRHEDTFFVKITVHIHFTWLCL